jgi:hypothetical protein
MTDMILASASSDDDDPMVIVTCAGPPVCLLQDDARAAAMANRAANCPWCKRITCHADGSETEEGPAHA